MDRYEPLRRRTIALVGLMGVGKSSVGRRLAVLLNLPFRDADTEVETAAGRSIPEIFADLGEGAFRDGERRVIARLLEGPPVILVHGLFGNANTLRAVGESLSSHLPNQSVYTVDMRNHGRSPRSPVHTYPGLPFPSLDLCF